MHKKARNLLSYVVKWFKIVLIRTYIMLRQLITIVTDNGLRTISYNFPFNVAYLVITLINIIILYLP